MRSWICIRRIRHTRRIRRCPAHRWEGGKTRGVSAGVFGLERRSNKPYVTPYYFKYRRLKCDPPTEGAFFCIACSQAGTSQAAF
jgi:hypothetical protein